MMVIRLSIQPETTSLSSIKVPELLSRVEAPLWIHSNNKEEHLISKTM